MNFKPVSNVVENAFEGIYPKFNNEIVFQTHNKIIQIIKDSCLIIYHSDYFECKKIRNVLGRLSVFFHRILKNCEDKINQSGCASTRTHIFNKIEDSKKCIAEIDRLNALILAKGVSKSVFEDLAFEINLKIISYFPIGLDEDLRVAISMLKSMFGCNKPFLYEKIISSLD